MRKAVTGLADKYIKSPAARAVAVELLCGLKAIEGLFGDGTLSPEQRDDIIRAHIVTFLDLPANTFWCDNRGYISPIVAQAMNAWIDAGRWALDAADHNAKAEARAEASVRVVGLRSAMIEIFLAVIYCEQGAAGLREVSYEVRSRLFEAME